MRCMSKGRFDKAFQTNTTPWAKRALDRLVAKLQASGRVRFNDKPLTRQAVFSLVWIWLDGMDLQTVESGLARQIPKLEAALGGIDPDTVAEAESGGRDVTHTMKVRKTHKSSGPSRRDGGKSGDKMG